jgi:hypothetical protein
VEVFRAAVALVARSMVVSAQSAGQQRLLWLQQSATVGGEMGELVSPPRKEDPVDMRNPARAFGA